MTGRVQVDPQRAFAEIAEFNRTLVQGLSLLDKTRDRDVQIATTPKREVFRQDKTVLYHYEPMAKREVKVPVLVVYGLIGRYTMADLQEDRSLMRNMLGQGVDLYVVDWGSPTRTDRWLTLDDYIDGYLHECILHICREHELEAIHLLGICEGGVFTLCYAALHPERVKSLTLTITPVDFHADQNTSAPLHHGLINLWARSLSPEDIDRAWMLDWHVPIGPFGLMDRIGLDVVRDIELVYFRANGDPSDKPPKVLDDLIAAGKLGVKTGEGFYKYPEPDYQKPGWLTESEK